MQKYLEFDPSSFRIVGKEVIDTVFCIFHRGCIGHVAELAVHIVHHFGIGVEKGQQALKFCFQRFTKSEQLVAVPEDGASSLVEPQFASHFIEVKIFQRIDHGGLDEGDPAFCPGIGWFEGNFN